MDDDAAEGVEVAGALINKGKLHKPMEVQIVSYSSPTITLSITNSFIDSYEYFARKAIDFI